MSIFSAIGDVFKAPLRATGILPSETADYSQQLGALENLPEYYSVGQLDPLAYRLGPSAMEQINLDPNVVAAQMAALQQLQDIGQQGGLTTADRAALQEATDATAIQERGMREAIQQQARSRGLGGGGIELAQQLISGQGAATRGAQAGRDIAQMAQARALSALQEAGSLAGNLHTQQYGEQSDLAQARDIISRFNLANRQAMETQNLANRQRLAEANVGGKRSVGFAKAGIYGKSAEEEAASKNEQAERQAKTMENVLKIISMGKGG